MRERFTRLDIIINNASQSVRRPAPYYAHLLAAESIGSPTELPSQLLGSPLQMLSRSLPEPPTTEGSSSASSVVPVEPSPATQSYTFKSALQSQLILLPEDSMSDSRLFPENVLDHNLQQLDLRETNSWVLKLEEIETPELAEVFAINTMAPFILNARLKSLMCRSPASDRFIVNVSAVEGQFSRSTKGATHPHTNMAKAAVNMMTRTSAQDYAKSNIFMTSVDTGWVSDESPLPISARFVSEQDFQPPLDEVDAAARVLDPVFLAVNSDQKLFGILLKDYVPVDW
eukprot:m.920420 g.920420  ORF g.920420 m.920420 type:complete len:286 (+) comp64710_c0_seq1:994-1851(+)